MAIFYSIAALIFVVIIHELGHAYAMIRTGVRIKEISLGFKLPILPSLSFRFNKKIPRLTLNPLLLGAYVEPSYGGGNKMQNLPYLDVAFVYGAGVWVNVIFALFIFLILEVIPGHAYPAHQLKIGGTPFDIVPFILAFIIWVLVFFPRFFCAYIVPILGILLAYFFLKVLLADFTMAVGGPITIVKMTSPAMKTWLGIAGQAALISLTIGLGNMLPLVPLDGGRIVGCYLKRWFGKSCEMAFGVVGLLCVAMLIAIAIFVDVSQL